VPVGGIAKKVLGFVQAMPKGACREVENVMKRIEERGWWFPGVLLLFFSVLCSGLFFLSSCHTALTVESLLHRVEKTTNGLESYHSLLEYEIIGEVNERYHVEQWYLAPSYYRIEIGQSSDQEQENGSVEQIFIANGEDIWLCHPGLGEFYLLRDPAPAEEYTPFLLHSYWRTLTEAEEISILGTEEKERHSYYLLKVLPARSRFNHAMEKLWLEQKTLLPTRIEIYSERGALTQIITFKKITLNPKIDPSIFKTDREQLLALNRALYDKALLFFHL
jgi:outer membrane lipoprotein-sorting protein